MAPRATRRSSPGRMAGGKRVLSVRQDSSGRSFGLILSEGEQVDAGVAEVLAALVLPLVLAASTTPRVVLALLAVASLRCSYPFFTQITSIPPQHLNHRS